MLSAGISFFVTCAYQPANVNCQILVPECDKLFVSSDRALLSHEVIVMKYTAIWPVHFLISAFLSEAIVLQVVLCVDIVM